MIIFDPETKPLTPVPWVPFLFYEKFDLGYVCQTNYPQLVSMRCAIAEVPGTPHWIIYVAGGLYRFVSSAPKVTSRTHCVLEERNCFVCAIIVHIMIYLSLSMMVHWKNLWFIQFYIHIYVMINSFNLHPHLHKTLLAIMYSFSSVFKL